MKARIGIAVLLPIASLLSAPIAMAQPRFGIESGVNLSTLDYDEELPVWENGWRPSFTAGVLIEFPFRERWSATAGVRYLQQGNRVEYDTGPGSVQQVGDFRVVQSYVSIPLLLEFRPLPSKAVFFSLGPELGLLISGRLIDEHTEDGGPEVTEYADILHDLAATNFSVDAGMGMRFPVENHEATVQIRYTHGLLDVSEDEAWLSDWTTRGIEALIGMRW